MKWRLLLLPVLLSAMSAQALEDCSESLAQIDRTIDSARQAGQSVGSAVEMRKSVEQTCAYLDQQTLDGMVEALAAMLPMMSSLDSHLAEVKSQEKQAAAQRQPVIEAPLPVIPESGRSLGGRLNDRPDQMHQFGIWDMDYYEGKARFLYHTRPTREQFASPDWEFVVYVVEVDRQGNPTQRLLTRRQASDHAALALRRGHDEMLLQRQPAERDGEARLERWSISRRSMLSSAPIPEPVRAGDGRWDRAPFLASTADGNFLFADVKSAPRTATEFSMGWFKVSPSGDLLSQGSLTSGDKTMPGAAVDVRGNGGAMLVAVSAGPGGVIDSRISTPISREAAGRSVQAHVSYEKRLLVVAEDGRSHWQSPALERMLSWDGDLAIPSDLTAQEALAQNRSQMEMMRATELEFDAGRSVASLDIGLKRVEMIKPLHGDRFAALARVSADRKLQPPVHGQYLLTVDEHSVAERLYLNPLADARELKFLTLAVSPSEQIYLLGVQQGSGAAFVYRVNAEGEFDGYARSAANSSISLEGLVADEDGVWLTGRGFADGKIGDRLWTERLQF